MPLQGNIEKNFEKNFRVKNEIPARHRTQRSRAWTIHTSYLINSLSASHARVELTRPDSMTHFLVSPDSVSRRLQTRDSLCRVSHGPALTEGTSTRRSRPRRTTPCDPSLDELTAVPCGSEDLDALLEKKRVLWGAVKDSVTDSIGSGRNG